MDFTPLQSAVMESLLAGGAEPAGADRIWQQAVAAYSDRSRSYHNLTHLVEMHTVLAEFEPLLSDVPSCVLALVYHDILYDSQAKDNEARSAGQARVDLAAAGVAEDRSMRVEELILSTAKHVPTGHGFDDRLFLDADLSILGARRDRYQEYMNAIRREYGWVKEEDYRKGRSAILEKFLTRPRIFYTEEIHGRLDNPARENLRYEISVLQNMRRLSGSISRTASNRKAYEIFQGAPDLMRAVAEFLERDLGFHDFAQSAEGIDQVAGEFFRGEVKILWGWDNWSGLYLTAEDEAGDILIDEIAERMEPHLRTPEFERYTQYW